MFIFVLVVLCTNTENIRKTLLTAGQDELLNLHNQTFILIVSQITCICSEIPIERSSHLTVQLILSEQLVKGVIDIILKDWLIQFLFCIITVSWRIFLQPIQQGG